MKPLPFWLRRFRLIGLTALALSTVCCAWAQPAPTAPGPVVPEGCKVLSYDDGKSDGMRSIAGATQMIAFEKPEGEWSLVEVWLFGSRYGYPAPPAENFDIYVCDPQMEVLKQYQRAYSTFDRGEARWVRIPLEAVLLPDKFFILFHFHAEQTKGVYVHFDTSVPVSHSWVAVWGGETQQMREKADWMIRAVIAPGKPESVPAAKIPPEQAPIVPATPVEPGAAEATGNTTVLKYDDGAPDGKRSIAGSGHAVLFAKPEGDWYLTTVHLFGSRYGYPQAPREDFYVYVCDRAFKVIKQYPLPYATLQRGAERWYDIAVDPVQIPDLFYVCFAFNPTRTKGVFVCFDKSVKQTHSKTGVPGKPLRNVTENLEWMIRATLTRAPGR